MINPIQDAINKQAREARSAEQEAALKTFDTPAPPPRKKVASLESLLQAYDKAVALGDETKTLKPRLEAEIASSLDTGDALNENVAHGIQIKRTQLELVPVKLEQIRVRLDDLTKAIQVAFDERFIAWDRQFSHLRGVIHKHLGGFLRPLLAEDYTVELMIGRLVDHTKLMRRHIGEKHYIEQRKAQGDVVGMARELMKRETEAAAILAEAEKLVASTAKE